MTSSFPPAKDHLGAIAKLLGIAVIVVPAIFWLAALEEAKNTAVDVARDQKQRMDKLEDRLRAQENNRSIDAQLNAIGARLVALEVKVDGVNETLKARKR